MTGITMHRKEGKGGGVMQHMFKAKSLSNVSMKRVVFPKRISILTVLLRHIYHTCVLISNSVRE